jgi:hypothetical protein
MPPTSEISILTKKKTRPAPGSANKNGCFPSWVALCQALAWPVVVLVLFSYCKTPVTELLNELPKVISKSKKITFSGVILEIGSTVTAPPGVKSSIANISKEELIQLINISDADEGYYLFGDFEQHEALVAALEKRHLLEVTKKEINHMNPELAHIVVKLTKLGRQTRKFALDVIIDQLVDQSGSS